MFYKFNDFFEIGFVNDAPVYKLLKSIIYKNYF